MLFHREGQLGGAAINKESIGRNWEFEVYWLFTGSLLLAALLPGNEKFFLPPAG